MKEVEEKVRDLLRPIVDRLDAFVVDLDIRTERGEKIVRAFVDTDTGITVEQCATISRELSHELALSNLIPGGYRLEISSPGLDRPLLLLRQYRKNIGRKFRVKYRVEGEARFSVATLENVEGDLLTFMEPSGKSFTVQFDSIIESKEELPW